MKKYETIIEENANPGKIKAAAQLKSNFYVDYLIHGLSSIEEVCQFRETASKICLLNCNWTTEKLNL